MAKQDGSKIREARTAAGLSQVALAEAAGNVSASNISKAERGIKELTPEQLEAVARVIEVPVESLLVADAEPISPEAEIPSDSVTKNEQQNANPMAAMMSMFSGMMGGENAEGGENPMAAMMSNFGGGENAEGGENPMAAMMGMFSGMMGGENAEGGENPMAAMMSNFGGGENAEGGENPMAAMMSMFSGMMGGENAEGGENPMAGMMKMFGGMMGGTEDKKEDE